MQADSEGNVATTSIAAPDISPQLQSLYHPLFSSRDGDTVLGSKDGILFRVHSFTLKTTSGWFRAMFSLPQRVIVAISNDTQTTIATPIAGSSSGGNPSTPPPAPSDTIFVDEDASTLESLLRLICGLPIPKIDSYDIVEPVLHAAEKYDMPGPLSIVRALLNTPPFLSDPLRLYTLCCRYGWYPEAQTASNLTLTINLHSPQYRQTLLKLSTTSLLNLIELHHSRRETLRARLNEPPFVNDTAEASCSHCGVPVNHFTWRELKYAIVTEMDGRPMGDMILGSGLDDWPSAKACWAAKCKNCDRVLYDKKETQRAIRVCVEKLPSKIDLSVEKRHGM